MNGILAWGKRGLSPFFPKTGTGRSKDVIDIEEWRKIQARKMS
jgi:hypothetical protein